MKVCIHGDTQSRAHQDASETDEALLGFSQAHCVGGDTCMPHGVVSCLLHICPFPHSHPHSYTQDDGHRYQLCKKIPDGEERKKKKTLKI